MGHMMRRTQDTTGVLDLSTVLRLARAADRARAAHRRRQDTIARHKARAEKQVLQALALQIDREHAAWLAAGSPEHGEVA